MSTRQIMFLAGGMSLVLIAVIAPMLSHARTLIAFGGGVLVGIALFWFRAQGSKGGKDG